MKARVFAVALSVTLCTAIDASGAITKGPYLQDAVADSITVTWETDTATASKVEWGMTPAYGQVIATPAAVTMHEVTITGLSPATVYYYRVEGDATGGTFTSAPSASQPFTFAVYADTNGVAADQQSVVNALIAEAPAFVVIAGDLVETGSDDAYWKKFFDIEKELLRNACVYTALGDRELVYDPTTPRYLALFTRPVSPSGGHRYYSFDRGNTHIAVLNSNEGLTSFSTVQQDWLKSDLNAARNDPAVEHIFTVMHGGPYSASAGGDNTYAKTAIVPILKTYHVDMTIAAQDRDYERGEVGGLRYLVSGGGGATLDSAGKGPGTITSEKTLNYVVFTVDGGRVDGCAKRPNGSIIECFGWGALPVDAGTPDAGPDAEIADAGTEDAGPQDTDDAGSQDASDEDAPAPADAAETDAGHPAGDSGSAADAGGRRDTGPILRPSGDSGAASETATGGGCSCAVLDLR